MYNTELDIEFLLWEDFPEEVGCSSLEDKEELAFVLGNNRSINLLENMI